MALEVVCGRCQAEVLIESTAQPAECPHCHGTLSADAVATAQVKRHAQVAPTPAHAPQLPTATDTDNGTTTVTDMQGLATVAAGGATRGDDTEILDQVPPLPAAMSPAPSAAAMPATPTGLGPAPWACKLLISYASAVTLLCIYLVWLLFQRGSPLDLPDIKDRQPGKSKNKVTVLYYVRPDRPLPAAHTLRLGQTARYGSLEITALRVIKAPLEFQYFDPESTETRPPSSDVLQLHLKLHNASRDQSFAPLDRGLVFAKEPDRNNPELIKANNFVCRVEHLASPARHVFVYDLPPDTNWNIVGQNLDRELGPGESIETFVPTTEEGLADLAGELAWRVHFRKGYNRQSLRGVTSLIEVRFHSSQISERAEPSVNKSV